MNDAWELAKQILYGKEEQTAEIFNIKARPVDLSQKREVINATTPQRARKMIDEWKKSQEIHVGDVVEHKEDNILGVVLKLNGNGYSYLLFFDGSAGVHEMKEFKKTGKHIDIHGILSQIGGE